MVRERPISPKRWPILATLDSFRGAPLDALVRVGADAAIVRATVLHDDGREVLVELELARNGRNRAMVNRQKLGRSRDLLGVMRVTVFSPDDLTIVKEGPGSVVDSSTTRWCRWL
jgi:DNA replication and repair protein RecF